MKIAMFMPYFAADPKAVPVLYRTWQKSAAMNNEIDFFVVTNLAVEEHKEYGNIHYIFMSADDFWEKLQSILDFPISHSYYKTAEYRVFFGIIFKDILRGYDYWGTTDPDVIYGDIMKFISPYLEQDAEVIGRYSPFRLIKNTESLCNMPFYEVKGMEHPLTLKDAFSTDCCWYFDEIAGMNVRYHQAGVKFYVLDECIADIRVRNRYLSMGRREGKWGFTWTNGKLYGYDDSGHTVEFLCIHLQKRHMTIEGDLDGADTFCVVPNRILSGCSHSPDISVKNYLYPIKKLLLANLRVIRQQRQMSPEAKLIYLETQDYCLKEGLRFPPEKKLIIRAWHALKRLIAWG